jgi:UDP-N-acetylmuramyl pentapeptide synthase
LADFSPVAGHGCFHDGMNSRRIFDESLQAETEDMRDCLAVLKSMPGERKIAILGSHPQHVHAAGQAAHVVLLVGKHMRSSEREAFLAGADVHCFDTAEEVSPWLTSFVNAGDMILIKGRKEAGLDIIVDKLGISA